MFVILVFWDLTSIAQESIFGMKCDSQYINSNWGGYKSNPKRRGRRWCSNSLRWGCVFLCVRTSPHLFYVACGDNLCFQKWAACLLNPPKFGHFPSLPGYFQNQYISKVISNYSHIFPIGTWLVSESLCITVHCAFLFPSPVYHISHNFLEA